MPATEHRYQPAHVVDVAVLTPNMIRIVFGGSAPEKLVPSGHSDERVRIAFPAPGLQHAEPPTCIDGQWGYHDLSARNRVRSYTIRRTDPHSRTVTVDFVVHEGGVASQWACRAAPGDTVFMLGPDGWHAPPRETTWQLLIADMTALPALARIAEELPACITAHAIIETHTPDDQQVLRSDAELTTTWYHGTGNGIAPSALPTAVSAYQLPDGPGYVWFAGEASVSRLVRKHARQHWGLPAASFDIIGYWREQEEHWLAQYRTVEAQVLATRQKAITEGKTATEVLEIYDNALEDAGL
ncbi:siderophore-interacting protein [Rhodococcus erythropolis]|uniref:siderophore-interacting protein n=1 Tax=Rhodococcus erythropolis TaxID=1833 RepID=UPI003790D87F